MLDFRQMFYVNIKRIFIEKPFQIDFKINSMRPQNDSSSYKIFNYQK